MCSRPSLTIAKEELNTCTADVCCGSTCVMYVVVHIVVHTRPVTESKAERMRYTMKERQSERTVISE